MSKKNKSAPTPIAALQAQFQQASQLHQQGFLAQAETIYSNILAANSKHVDALHYFGILATQTGRHDMAIELMEKAAAINSHQYALFSNLGNAHKALSRHEQAIHAYRKAIALKADFFQAHCNLAYALSAIDQHEQALVHFNAALAHKPDLFEALLGKAIALQTLERFPQAIETLDLASKCNPGNDHAYDLLGNTLRTFGLLNESNQHFQEALRLNPNRVTTWVNLGGNHYDLGQLPTSIHCYQQAIQVDKQDMNAHSCLLFSMSISPEHSPQAYVAQAQSFRDVLASLSTPFQSWTVPALGNDQKLRIGLVSGDFKSHPVGYFLESLVAHLDASKVALYAYSSNTKEDALTARLKPCFSTWRNIQGLTDSAAAKLVHDDGIQILIDLSGHTQDNMLAMFAWQPAPVQISWLGFFASTGVPHMNWLLADSLCVPVGDESHFTERIVRMPHTRLCYTPSPQAPDIAPLPAMSKGHITFGSFQPLVKLTDGVLTLWARVLAALPNAKLRLQNTRLSQPTYQALCVQRLQQFGIDIDRVTLHGHAPISEYLRSHNEVDIILDTFPYTGGTTTCDALWMGVPTLTLAGNTMASRQGAAIMTASGLPDWVASNHDAFVELAVTKANDLASMSNMRENMRSHLLSQPMFDAPRFAADWLTTMQQLWAQASPSLNLQLT